MRTRIVPQRSVDGPARSACHDAGVRSTTRGRLVVGAWLSVLALALEACAVGVSSDAEQPVLDDSRALEASGAVRLSLVVLGTTPHDPTAFTEGFELDPGPGGGSLWESTGLEGRSQVRELDPVTGTERRAVALPEDVYGEGITVLPDRLWQLTYRNRQVYERDPATLAVRRVLPFDREGWGACHDAGRVVTSDGTDELVFRDPVSFAATGSVRVHVGATPVRALNELACTPGAVWANVWRSDHVVRVDPGTGRVTAVADAGGLLPADQNEDADVLNGVADIPGTDEFLLTGKLWPTTFRVRFVPR
jgi:glutaminyl-peptide cyclotransferase